MQRWARDTVVYTDTVCAGSPRQGYSVQEPVNIRQADSVHIYIYNVYMADTVHLYDTVIVERDSLPVSWERQYLNREGDYRTVVKADDGCLSVYHMHLEITERPDALPALLQGEEQTEKFVYKGKLYIRHHGAIYDVTGNKVNITEI